jgi:hypothetical protein
VEIRRLVNNETAFNAIKKVLLYSVYYSGVLKPGENPDFLRNFFLSILIEPRTGQEYKLNNEELGQKLRARVEALAILDDGFKKLAQMAVAEAPKEEEKNQAR